MTFREFFEAIWGPDKSPFPWQEDLAELVLQGRWPSSIGLPTAAGKTALIDIAVFALAMRAHNAARRIFFVVDRRVIVDEAAARAETLAKRLIEADPTSELGKLARGLCALGDTHTPLMTATLRGGVPRDTSWTDSPLQPTIICSTVDQVGSSLLFRAYGASEYGRPIRAGLAAYDSLIILDEAHTSQPFAETLRWISQYRGWAERPLDFPFTAVEMSATPREEQGFRETERDRQDPILKERWETEKRAKLVIEESELDAEGEQAVLVKGLAREARALRDQRGARVIGVIANRVMTARRVHQEIKQDAGCESILLTGRARPYDRDKLWEKWRPHIGIGRERDQGGIIFVVATQCIEVGANIDFDGLVTEIASIDALEQRFGRLARDGSEVARYAAIVTQKNQIGKNYDDPIYGRSLSAVWRWLKEHVKEVRAKEAVAPQEKKKAKTKKINEEFVPMGVLALRQALEDMTDRQALTMPRRSSPVLMPAHVDLLCQTSPEPDVSPESAVFLHGPESGPADVQVVWRQDLEISQNPDLWRDLVAICPPNAAEAISLPVWAVRDWLSKQTTRDLTDIEGLGGGETSGRNDKGPVLAWRGADESKVLTEPAEIRPGMTIVVPAIYGGCDEWGWNPESLAEVTDIGDPVKLQMGRTMLRLHPKLIDRWKYPELAGRIQAAESAWEARAALNGALDSGADEWVHEAVAELLKRRPKFVENPAEGGDTWAALIGRGTFDQESARASYTVEVPLDEHLAGCAKRAASFGRELPNGVRETIVRAAELHDIGKADPRFQAWLRGGNPVKSHELIAKSERSGQNPRAIERARELARYPKGGRHELMSVRLLSSHQQNFAGLDFDLLLHLIGSHHGRCRPFAPVVDDDESVHVTYRDWSAPSNHRLESAASGACERFWRLTRRYGWYGLSFLETLVRLSDQRQSEAEEERKEPAEVAHA